MASSVSGSEVSEGPVLTLFSKRLRALKKKHNRILQLEATHLANDKTLNNEQVELLNSKPVVAALMDEYEKLRQPLSAAVHEEISKNEPKCSSNSGEIEDLLGLIYFSSLFDVKPQSEFTSTMLTRTHERGCCLTYDYVTDDATELLRERDLDMISAVGGMMVARPVYSGVSHKDALEGCVRHAGLWLRNADQQISPDYDVTYAGLREKLNKIMASDYFTTTPEMKAPVDVAAELGKYSTTTETCRLVEGEDQHEKVDVSDQVQYGHKDDEQEDVQATEASPRQSSPVNESPKEEAGEFNPPLVEAATVHREVEKLVVDSEEEIQQDAYHKQQQHQYVPRRQYQNQRGGGRAGGGRHGYYHGGRGGRGGGSSYQNGRNQQYYESEYYPRNSYNTGGRRGGGRSGGSYMYNSNAGAATRDSPAEVRASS